MSERLWLWLLGLPRSGTTVFAYILSQHPECNVLWETHFPLHFRRILRPWPMTATYPFEVTWSNADGDSELERWGLHTAIVDGHGGIGLEDFPHLQVTRSLCEALRSFWSGRYFGDKSPRYCFEWPAIAELFPESRFVRTLRPIEECVASIEGLQAAGRWNPDIDAASALPDYERAADTCTNAVRVHLNDLKREPKQVIARLLDELSLDVADYPMGSVLRRLADGPLN